MMLDSLVSDVRLYVHTYMTQTLRRKAEAHAATVLESKGGATHIVVYDAEVCMYVCMSYQSHSIAVGLSFARAKKALYLPTSSRFTHTMISTCIHAYIHTYIIIQ